MSLEGYIEKYGNEDGIFKWNEYCSKMDLTSKKSFINRYGEVDGLAKFTLYSEKIKYRMSIRYYIDTYGEEVGRYEYNEFLRKKIKSTTKKHSKIS